MLTIIPLPSPKLHFQQLVLEYNECMLFFFFQQRAKGANRIALSVLVEIAPWQDACDCTVQTTPLQTAQLPFLLSNSATSLTSSTRTHGRKSYMFAVLLE